MRPFARRWRPRHLLMAWVAYWLGLILVALGPAIGAIFRMSQDPASHGTASGAFSNGVISMTVTQAGAATYSGSVSLLSLVLLAGGPPIIIWLVWLFAASRMNNAGEARVRGVHPYNELHAANQRTGIVDASNTKRSALEES